MKNLIRLLTVALMVGICGMATRAGEAKTVDPRSLSIYQIMVGSFQHAPEGAPGYTAMWGPDNATKNGNLRGIINALDSIRSLGVNAIWLTPIFDSTKAMGGEKLQSTGYFTNNFFAIDPNFGTEADFRELVDGAHSRGMLVLLDGVFGHHGGVTEPSPSGHRLDTRQVFSDRGVQGGTGNIAYPGSLPYIKELATYWIDRYGIDGWRLDQAYQATQGGHNYLGDIRAAVDSVTALRRARGEQWGTLGYLVGEDWGTADVINRGVYRDGGLLSAFDFDGKERISGPMQSPIGAGLDNGWVDIMLTLSEPAARGYLNNEVMPNLFLTNHDGYRLADHFDLADPQYYDKLKYRHGILAAYPGPITLYYGDEFADRSIDAPGAQKDNIARTSGHIVPRNDREADLKQYIASVLRFRADNPATWRGNATFSIVGSDDPWDPRAALLVIKQDPESPNRVAIIFSERDTTIDSPLLPEKVDVSAYVPRFIRLN